jgi:hypothetical protein
MSFLPISRAEWQNRIAQWVTIFFQKFGEDLHETPNPKNWPLNIPCIYPYFRTGGLGFIKSNNAILDVIAGGQERFYAAYPGRLSADLM